MDPSNDSSPQEPFEPPRGWVNKFRNAWRGLWSGCVGQSSFRVHWVAAILVVLAGYWVRLSTPEWCILLICIGMVFALELINTSIEQLAKAVTRQYNENVRSALDLSASAVLVASGIAVIVGLLVLLPKLLERL